MRVARTQKAVSAVHAWCPVRKERCTGLGSLSGVALLLEAAGLHSQRGALNPWAFQSRRGLQEAFGFRQWGFRQWGACCPPLVIQKQFVCSSFVVQLMCIAEGCVTPHPPPLTWKK